MQEQIIELVVRLFRREHGYWEGTSSELLEELRDMDEHIGRVWPSAIELGKLIRQAKDDLLRQGINLTTARTATARLIRLRCINLDKLQQRPQETPPQPPAIKMLIKREMEEIGNELIARKRAEHLKEETTPRRYRRYPWNIPGWRW